MIRRPPRSTRTDTLFPYTTLFRSSFVDRFDANSYLYITRAMDYFDLGDPHGGRLADAFRQSPVRFGLVSFDSDWLYPTAESRRIVQALHAAGAQASFVELSSPFGHDAFLPDSPALRSHGRRVGKQGASTC